MLLVVGDKLYLYQIPECVDGYEFRTRQQNLCSTRTRCAVPEISRSLRTSYVYAPGFLKVIRSRCIFVIRLFKSTRICTYTSYVPVLTYFDFRIVS